ncbi:MAG: DEAD/DEAH box helicase family protein, partial [Gemmatimonadota bacterium]|nr:DEAD/DEAH box helicase family protein [Gemmatimonadota bacterium]
RQLLARWFPADGHRLPGRRVFRYHPFQREAIETLIYLYEVADVRRQKELLERYAQQFGGVNLQLLQHDEFPRYALKMATGSGKTKVMSLAIVWQYMNAVVEGRNDYARTFLVLAPNAIVYERLRTDFANAAIFRTDPLIPPELRVFWDFDVYLRGEGERASSNGALYLTNIQQLHDRGGPTDDEPAPIAAVLGPRPPAQAVEIADFPERIAARGGPCVVVNDEAHHTHDEKLKWNEIIRDLHEALGGPASPPDPPTTGGINNAALEGSSPPSIGGLGGHRSGGPGPGGQLHEPGVIQLDFTATPRFNKGQLFTWTVYDYPLKQAILDGIVKRPVKGMTPGVQERPSDHASVRYQTYLTAAVERWREYREQLAPLDKKPLLFVMMNETAEADDVGEYLQTKYPGEFGGDKLLIIHTNRSGDITKRDEDRARRVAREVDDAESPVNAIVSVLMLREGWDVQNVTVIVGLRPYSSKANILPEQTIGRGLRLMFRGLGSSYTERVDVIGNPKFMEFIDQLERDEDLKLEQFTVGKDKLVVVTIAPDSAKLDRDIELPTLSPILVRKRTLAEEIAALDVAAFRCPPLPLKESSMEAKRFRYEGYDILTMQKLVEREYRIPEPQTAQEVISFYAKRIAQDVKLPGQFAALVPRVREFLETRAFGQPVSLEGKEMIQAISSNVARFVTVDLFVKALRQLVLEEQTPQVLAGRKLSETPPFPYSRPTFVVAKTVFNLVTCDNEFEGRFARFLQNAPDVERFAKLPTQFGFSIDYTDSAANLRYYEPDFVAILADGSHRLVETKGREDLD